MTRKIELNPCNSCITPQQVQGGEDSAAYTRALMSVRASIYLYKSEISYVMFRRLGFASFNLFSNNPQIPAQQKDTVNIAKETKNKKNF